MTRARVPSATRPPSASTAAAMASMSSPMPRRGNQKPSGADWPSSRRRTRWAGMRSRGIASTFSRYGRMRVATVSGENRSARYEAAVPSGGSAGAGRGVSWSR